MNGRTEQNDGDEVIQPGIWDAIYSGIRIVFFEERFVYYLFLHRKHMLNTITVFALFLLIPNKMPFTETNVLFHPGHYIEAVILTLAYICIVFGFVATRVRSFGGFMRVMLVVEAVDILGPASFFLEGSALVTFTAVHLAWYLSVTVFVTERLARIGYVGSTLVVMSAFFLTMLLPAFFV